MAAGTGCGDGRPIDRVVMRRRMEGACWGAVRNSRVCLRRRIEAKQEGGGRKIQMSRMEESKGRMKQNEQVGKEAKREHEEGSEEVVVINKAKLAKERRCEVAYDSFRAKRTGSTMTSENRKPRREQRARKGAWR